MNCTRQKVKTCSFFFFSFFLVSRVVNYAFNLGRSQFQELKIQHRYYTKRFLKSEKTNVICLGMTYDYHNMPIWCQRFRKSDKTNVICLGMTYDYHVMPIWCLLPSPKPYLDVSIIFYSRHPHESRCPSFADWLVAYFVIELQMLQMVHGYLGLSRHKKFSASTFFFKKIIYF